MEFQNTRKKPNETTANIKNELELKQQSAHQIRLTGIPMPETKRKSVGLRSSISSQRDNHAFYNEFSCSQIRQIGHKNSKIDTKTIGKANNLFCDFEKPVMNYVIITSDKSPINYCKTTNLDRSVSLTQTMNARIALPLERRINSQTIISTINSHFDKNINHQNLNAAMVTQLDANRNQQVQLKNIKFENQNSQPINLDYSRILVTPKSHNLFTIEKELNELQNSAILKPDRSFDVELKPISFSKITPRFKQQSQKIDQTLSKKFEYNKMSPILSIKTDKDSLIFSKVLFFKNQMQL